jgi:ankyrin repeat protein/ribosomal protein L37E
MTNEQSIQRELIASIEAGDVEAVRALIGGGVEVNHRGNDPDGESALMRGIGAGELAVVRLLISAGAEVNCAGKLSGWTALMLAHDSAEMVEVLLAAGADVKARSYACELKEGGRKVRRGGETALHFAAAANNAEVVRKLIAAGSEVEALDRSGCAPLDVALRVGAVTAAAEVLVEGGAKLTAERLEAMHSGAYDGGSELRMFPAVDLIELKGSNEEAGVEGGRGKEGGVKCEHCGALTYSRKARICGSCGKGLSPALGVGDDQRARIDGERKWAQQVANSFDAKRRTMSGNAVNESFGNEVAVAKLPASLLRDFTFAEEFRRRKRPLFWVQVGGYVVALGMLQVIAALGIIRLPPGVVVALTLVMLVVCWRAWRGADPKCPKCRRNVRFCEERFCCVCGKAMANGRCAECMPGRTLMNAGRWWAAVDTALSELRGVAG